MADDADGPKRQSTKTLPRPLLFNQLSHEKLPQTAIKEGWRKAKTLKMKHFSQSPCPSPKNALRDEENRV